EELKEAQAHLQALGIEVLTVVNDLSKFDQIPGLVDRVLEAFGQIDILINNAGTTWSAPAEDYPEEAWHKVMNLNVSAPFFLAREVGKRSMIPRQRGKIINIASVAGLKGTASGVHTIAYNTSKAAAINFTRTLAAEWGRYNINVNAICPGFFPSKMSAGLLEKVEDMIVSHTPLQRLRGDEGLKGPGGFLARGTARAIPRHDLAGEGRPTNPRFPP